MISWVIEKKSVISWVIEKRGVIGWVIEKRGVIGWVIEKRIKLHSYLCNYDAISVLVK